VIQIPITNQPNQKFRVTVPVNGVNIPLNFQVSWNEMGDYWQMDIADALTDEDLIVGLPTIVGQDPAQNLLDKFEYMEIGEAYVVPIAKNLDRDWPGLTDWGTNFILLWGP
jgi:hypothetical protein